MSTVHHIRKAILDISQADLAAIANTTQASVSRWEKGELQPDLEQLRRIRDAVRQRGLAWEDSWFFDAPAVAAKEAAE